MNPFHRIARRWLLSLIALAALQGWAIAGGNIPSILVPSYRYQTGVNPPGEGTSPEAACFDFYTKHGYDQWTGPPASFQVEGVSGCRVLNDWNQNTIEYWGIVQLTDYVETCGPNSGPPLAGKCPCANNYEPDLPGTFCVYYSPTPPQAANSCRAMDDGMMVGHPIIPATGEKVYSRVEYSDGTMHGLRFELTYRSGWALGTDRRIPSAGLGRNWSHNYHVRVVPDTATLTQVISGDGKASSFENVAGTWVSLNGADVLARDSGTGHWSYTDRTSDTQWEFDEAGKPLTSTLRNGWVTSFSYSTTATASSIAPVPGLLIGVTNNFGRTISFRYHPDAALVGVTMPDARLLTIEHSGTQIYRTWYRWSVFNTFVYEVSGKPHLLTGIYNYNGRLATYTYDGNERATDTTHAGGADHFSVSYSGAASRVVTDPLGNAVTYGYQANRGDLVVTSATAASPQGRPDAASRVQGLDGLVTSETDFLGISTNKTWDSARRLPLSETRAYGRPEERTVSTQWHSTFRLPTLITEPGRTTAYTYDSLGNKLSEGITDLATNVTRTTTWTYGTASLPATMTDAKGGLWQYTWDAQGNLTNVTDPLNRVTAYQYDSYGHVAQVTAPNGRVTTYAWDDRSRLSSFTDDGDSTTFSYDAMDQLILVAFANARWLSIGRDDANRINYVGDRDGNSVNYTLDGFGNAVAETSKDPGGNVVKALTRVMNTVNRVAQIKDSANNPTTYAYDANGEQTGETDALSHTTSRTLDGLRRPTAITFADSSSAAQGWNGLDQLVSATDPKGVQTTYQRNAFGEVIAESSPDSGTTTFQRDALGAVTQRTDANGNVTTITRDAIGRPTAVQYAAGHVATFTYDATPALGVNQTGYLSAVEDPSGAIAYERDLKGRVTKKTQTVNDNPSSPASFTAQYLYISDNLYQITYPSGLLVYYTRGGNGEIRQVDIKPPSSGWLTFASSVTWTPLKQPRSWTWFNGDSTSRAFDLDGRMSSNEIASYTYDAAGRIVTVAQSVSGSATTTGAGPYASSTLTWTVGYDNRDRVTSFSRNGAGTSYTYDANSNRLTSLSAVTRDTDLDNDLDAADTTRGTAQALAIGTGSNRLLGFAQTVTRVQGSSTLSSVSTSVTYSLDANGNLTGDGLRAFEYDAANRLSKARISHDGEAASVRYLHNALGQRVFKGEITPEQYLPDESTLGQDFIDWLRRRFKWMFESQQASTSIGTAYLYADEPALPSWAALGSYDNGSASGTGRTEYIWLPLPDGGAIPIGMYRNGQSYAIHTDHLGTPRQMTDASGTPVWQWPYSAFGQNRPIGVLVPTTDPLQATTIEPTMLKATTPTVTLDLRFPGQMADVETGTFYNYYRNYVASQGRYSQADPIGLDGGWNSYVYVNGSPLMYTDPEGLLPQGAVDFSAGMGDVLLFGQGQRLRDLFGVDGGIDQCSDEYSAGEWAGIAGSLATGFAGGLKAAGTKGAGKEFSHWIPNRMGGPRTVWNGNYVPTATHAVSDPYRYRFMPRAWKEANAPMSAPMAQWTRVPNVYKGGAVGGAYGAAGAAQSGCTCSR